MEVEEDGIPVPEISRLVHVRLVMVMSCCFTD